MFGYPEQAINRSLLQDTIDSLLRAPTTDHWSRDYLLNWIHEYQKITGERLPWIVGSPEAHAKDEIQRWTKDLRRAIQRISNGYYPMGVESSHRLNLHARKDARAALMMSILMKRSELFWQMRKSYQTMIGEVAHENCGLFSTETFFWMPWTAHPEQEEARWYTDECRRLQAGPQGRKAKELLMDNLEDYQARDYLEKGYFFVRPKEPDVPLEDRKLYVIERGFPNGNILEVFKSPSQGLTPGTTSQEYIYPLYTFCYHAKDPHPLDDILLAQKFMIEDHHDEFLIEANRSGNGNRVGVEPLHYSSRAI